MGARAVRRDDAGRAARHSRGGIPPDRRPRRSRGQLDPHAEGADARQAVLRVLRSGRHARAPPRSSGVGGQVQGAVRRGLGCAAGAHLRASEGTRGDPRRRRADSAPRGDPRVGRDARRAEARPRARDGSVCGVPRAHGLPRGSGDRRDRRSRRAREHAHLLHHRRQRSIGRGHPQRRLQRDGQLQRHGRSGDPGVHDLEDRRARVRPRPTTTTRSAGPGR